jgi:hypothetical protein
MKLRLARKIIFSRPDLSAQRNIRAIRRLDLLAFSRLRRDNKIWRQVANDLDFARGHKREGFAPLR